MSAEELEEYEAQLATIEEDLLEDPSNQSLLDLKEEIKDLIGLIRQAINEGIEDYADRVEESGKRASNRTDSLGKDSKESSIESVTPEEVVESKKKQAFRVGDVILARWLSGDKQYYQAKITSVTGSSHNPMYTVRFTRKDIKSVETVNSDCVRPLLQNRGNSASVTKESQFKPSFQAELTSTPNDHTARTRPTSSLESGRPVNDTALSDKAKKPSHLPSKAQLLDTNKQKWQQFTKKGLKMGKGVKSKKLGESSMFQSPLDATGKVGVVNSGRGVTKPKPRARHVFDSSTRINDYD
jgi:survival-of-motor-neuron-related-splicing factor 30